MSRGTFTQFSHSTILKCIGYCILSFSIPSFIEAKTVQTEIKARHQEILYGKSLFPDTWKCSQCGYENYDTIDTCSVCGHSRYSSESE